MSSLFVTKRRSSWACIGNPKPEQETMKDTHAQEMSAYQRRPTTQHAAQGSNPPRHMELTVSLQRYVAEVQWLCTPATAYGRSPCILCVGSRRTAAASSSAAGMPGPAQSWCCIAHPPSPTKLVGSIPILEISYRYRLQASHAHTAPSKNIATGCCATACQGHRNLFLVTFPIGNKLNTRPRPT